YRWRGAHRGLHPFPTRRSSDLSSYQLKLDGDGHGHFLGAVVTGIENQVTRKMVPFKVHPWMLPSCALIRSETLPVPDSHISATRSEEHTSELQSRENLVCRLLL